MAQSNIPGTNPTPRAGDDSEAVAFARWTEDHVTPQKLAVTRGDGNAVEVVAVPRGLTLQSVKHLLDEQRETPERIRGTAKLDEVDSFLSHVGRFRGDSTAIYASRSTTSPGFVAVYDYHAPGAPAWGQHRAEFRPALAQAWRAWQGANGKEMDTGAFAEWWEEHAVEVLDPATEAAKDASLRLRAIDLRVGTPSEVLALSRGLEIRVEQTLSDVKRLATGEMKLTYEEQVKGSNGAPLDVPAAFVVGVPVFDEGVDGDVWALPVRLRMRRQAASITWSFHLLDADVTFRRAVDGLIEKVSAKTGLPVLIGTPE